MIYTSINDSYRLHCMLLSLSSPSALYHYQYYYYIYYSTKPQLVLHVLHTKPPFKPSRKTESVCHSDQMTTPYSENY